MRGGGGGIGRPFRTGSPWMRCASHRPRPRRRSPPRTPGSTCAPDEQNSLLSSWCAPSDPENVIPRPRTNATTAGEQAPAQPLQRPQRTEGKRDGEAHHATSERGYSRAFPRAPRLTGRPDRFGRSSPFVPGQGACELFPTREALPPSRIPPDRHRPPPGSARSRSGLGRPPGERRGIEASAHVLQLLHGPAQRLPPPETP